MKIDWKQAPTWAGSVVSDLFENLYWVVEFGTNCQRQEFGMPQPDPVNADMSTPGHNWQLVETRPR